MRHWCSHLPIHLVLTGSLESGQLNEGVEMHTWYKVNLYLRDGNTCSCVKSVCHLQVCIFRYLFLERLAKAMSYFPFGSSTTFCNHGEENWGIQLICVQCSMQLNGSSGCTFLVYTCTHTTLWFSNLKLLFKAFIPLNMHFIHMFCELINENTSIFLLSNCKERSNGSTSLFVAHSNNYNAYRNWKPKCHNVQAVYV